MLVVAGTSTVEADTLRSLRIAHYVTSGAAPATQRMLELSLHDVGVTPVMVDVPLARALIEVDKGEILDADPARVMEALRAFPNVVAVPEPVYQLRLGAFIRRGSPPVTGWPDLQSREVIAYRGSVLLDRLLVENHIAHVTRADTYVGALLMLASRRGDVAILPSSEVAAALAKLPVQFIEPSGPVLADVPLFFVLNKRYADLAQPLAAAIRRHRAEAPAH